MDIRRVVTLSAVSCLLGGAFMTSSFAGEENLAAEDLKASGESQSCLSLSHLRDSDPISNTLILFEMRNGTRFKNSLRGSCASLGRFKRFSYQTTQNKICKGDVITSSDPVGRPIGSCALGSFERLTEIETNENAGS